MIYGVIFMKIGEISAVSGVSKETIRYYMSLGLLMPIQQNTQYVFHQRELEDLEFIQLLKEMHFNLKEIGEVLSLRRTSNWIEPETLTRYVQMLRNKRGELHTELQQLQGALEQIAEEIEVSVAGCGRAHPVVGVPLRALPLLACPTCGTPLRISDGTFFQRSILSGTCHCPCGYQAKILDGVLCTDQIYTGNYDSPDLNRELYQGLCPEFLRIYQQCCDFIVQELSPISLKNKVVLEGNINGYFFLYRHLRTMEKDALYIITDKYPQVLQQYKVFIESLDLDLDILYIADAAGTFPLAKGCVDVQLDFFSNTEFQFYHRNSFTNQIAPLLTEKAQVIGSYMEYPSYSQSRELVAREYPEGSANAYHFPALLDDFNGCGLRVNHQHLASIYKTHDQLSFRCHHDGDEMKIHTYHCL